MRAGARVCGSVVPAVGAGLEDGAGLCAGEEATGAVGAPLTGLPTVTTPAVRPWPAVAAYTAAAAMARIAANARAAAIIPVLKLISSSRALTTARRRGCPCTAWDPPTFTALDDTDKNRQLRHYLDFPTGRQAPSKQAAESGSAGMRCGHR